jgi:SET domain-containing protein
VFLIKTTLRDSSIHGLGVFAGEFIKKGTVIWRFMPPFDQAISVADIDASCDIIKGYMNRFGHQSPVFGYWILCGDNARFMNHSKEPNTHGIYTDLKENFDIAGRDIEVGEELTCDYDSFILKQK